MIGYRFLSPAEEEMNEAAVFYDAASKGLGHDFLDDVQQAIDRLCEYPQAGEWVSSKLRRTLLHRFPFSIFYSAETGVILVNRDRASWPASRLLADAR
ncbi:MAG: hypothetical protein QOJ64_3804 [Acidobacteriota bacterium]|jgi:hypothetical protein|nr:hypothetical protein [Acidobacteriota bacterium]